MSHEHDSSLLANVLDDPALVVELRQFAPAGSPPTGADPGELISWLDALHANDFALYNRVLKAIERNIFVAEDLS